MNLLNKKKVLMGLMGLALISIANLSFADEEKPGAGKCIIETTGRNLKLAAINDEGERVQLYSNTSSYLKELNEALEAIERLKKLGLCEDKIILKEP